MSTWKPASVYPKRTVSSADVKAFANTWSNVTVQGPMLFPWGKHKGTPVKDVPRDYLDWAVRSADKMSPELRDECERVLGLPAGSTTPPPETELLKSRIYELESALNTHMHEAAALRRELVQKDHQIRSMSRTETRDQPTDMDRFRRIVKGWFAAMSRKFHPDLGGSAEKQTVLNLAYRDLIGRLDKS